MKFLLVLKERGEGCDYMIGCGMTYLEIEADSQHEARCKAEEYVLEWYGCDEDSDGRISEVWLAQEPEKLDTARWYEERAVRRRGREEQLRIQADMNLLAKLKAKYEQ